MIPETILLEQVDLGDRGRTSYNRIEELAQSIKDNGLIQPIVLVPLCDGPSGLNCHFGLDAGGRRFRALQLLETKVLYHATTSDPTRPGFVLKGEDQSAPLKRLFTEIAENLDRDNLDWRDEMRLLTRAYRLSEAEANAEGKHILMRDFGAMLGVGYAELQAAVAIHDDVVVNPERYKDCQGIRAAYTTLLKINAEEMNKLAAAKSIQRSPLMDRTDEPVVEVRAQDEPERVAPIHLPLSQAFFNQDAIEFMKGLPAEKFDHIITDPDYGVSKERLAASVSGASAGVAHETIQHSLASMAAFIVESFRLIKPQGFLVFWYDLDHHEKLQQMASNIGFAVQRWPLIWHKTDYRSNAAPAHNFCKNIEYAMVCRKPNAVLTKVQMSSVYQCPSGEIVRELGHPFAKPYELWTWIYTAVAIKGQSVFDPFFGCASSSIAALRWGLRPVGCEISPEHYAGGIMNLQTAYRKELGNNVTFS